MKSPLCRMAATAAMTWVCLWPTVLLADEAWFGCALTWGQTNAVLGALESDSSGSNAVSGLVITMLDPLATPAVSPEFDASPTGTVVTVSCASPYARIHYTTDFVDPAEYDARPTNGQVAILQDATLKVRAFRDWSAPSTGIAMGNYYASALRPRLGEFVPPLAGTAWDADPDHAPRVMPWPTNDMPPAVPVTVNGSNLLLCVNPGGVMLVGWWKPPISGFVTQIYAVAATPVAEPVRVYPTEGGAVGPPIDLSAVYRAILHTNEAVSGGQAWLSGGPGTYRLHAATRAASAFAVMHYEDLSRNLRGVEVVDFRPPVPDVTDHAAMGSWLAPHTAPGNLAWPPHVGRGRQTTRTEDEYIYQHEKAGDAYDGALLAVQPNGDPANMEVFWMQERQFGIRWPYEMHRYTVSDPTQTSVRVYHTEGAAEVAPKVNTAASGYDLVIHPNQAITSSDIWEQAGTPGIRELHASNRAGYVLVHYEESGLFKGMEIVEVRPYLPDSLSAVEVGARLQPQVARTNMTRRQHVARGLMTSLNDADNGIWQHRDSGAPGPYEGALFAARPAYDPMKMEIFWLQRGLFGVEWPCEMHRYTADWPDDPQRYVRTYADVFPKVAIPVALNAWLMPYREFGDPLHDAHLLNNATEFSTDGEGFSLLKFETGNPGSRSWVGFEVVHSVWHDNPDFFDLTPTNWPIGREITHALHAGPKAGYVHKPIGNRYAPDLYGDAGRDALGWTTGLIYAVNTGTMEVWWSHLVRPTTNSTAAIQWPSQVVRYNNLWPTAAPLIVIASQQGTGPIDETTFRNPDLYVQNSPSAIGFNPNDEHAVMRPSNGGFGQAIFPLRHDLGRPDTSEPFVLMTYTDTNGFRRLNVWAVVDQTPAFPFRYSGQAGTLVQPPFPLSTWPQCDESYGESGPWWRDRKLDFWAKAAGATGAPADMVMRFYYPVAIPPDDPKGFFFPPDYPAPPTGRNVAWLDSGVTGGTPVAVTYAIHWPDTVPDLLMGETLTTGRRNGQPDLWGQTSVEIIYQQGLVVSGKESVKLIDPIRIRAVPLAAPPTGVETLLTGGRRTFPTLPPHLRNRITYDDTGHQLRLCGERVTPPAGETYLLLNVLTAREKSVLAALAPADTAWQTAVNTLHAQAGQVLEVEPNTPFDQLALTAGSAEAPGYVTLAFNNSTNLNAPGDPVSLAILQVTNRLYTGELKVVESDQPFDETLVLRHSGDFAGLADRYRFQWRTLPPDSDGSAPDPPPDEWSPYPGVTPVSGDGALDISIKGPGLFTLSDNYLICRYQSTDPGHPCGTNWSEWTSIQLAEGWIRRVVNGISPFEQRFHSFEQNQVNTIVNMIQQAGPRAVGTVPLNQQSANERGLIEIYETVLKRGMALSINGTPPVNYPPANDALLLAAGRMNDLYMLLGNEAYGDASDPTIGFGTDSGDYGEAAPSVHCFMNQTASLLDEELQLLRGRTDQWLPATSTYPFYNRLIWNFSGDIMGGEPAYVLNYGITDVNSDGFVSEADAAKLYPQGHGDAWGHYLTAIKTYYRLLKHPSFGWAPRIEAVIIGGVPVNVDFLDERNFAKAGAAKAKTGAEIVNLTYRDQYTEDPAGQWQGYQDTDPRRAWGLSEWAQRAGQGALFDWVVANSLLPAADTTHTGIQRIDRTTVLELRDIAGAFHDIQAAADGAEAGLNPLGIARNAVPFDIDPSLVAQGRTHFEQVYDRTVQAMNNAIVTFNHAQGVSAQLRRQADSVQQFQRSVTDREADFTSRLIELYGYPYEDDIGPGKTYPTGYDGPDLYHFMYVDPNELIGDPASTREVNFTFQEINLDPETGGLLDPAYLLVTFHLSDQGFGFIKPRSWTGRRRAAGEMQMTQSDLLLAKARFDRALQAYQELMNQIEDLADLLMAQYGVSRAEIGVLDAGQRTFTDLNNHLTWAHTETLDAQFNAQSLLMRTEAALQLMPSMALTQDPTLLIRAIVHEIATENAVAEMARSTESAKAELGYQLAKETAQADQNRQLTILRQGVDIEQFRVQLEQLVRRESALRLDIYEQQEEVHQVARRYEAILARAQRLRDEDRCFRQQTAAQIQNYRYKDMAFRVFRNDALQKYRAQFDLAAKYVYLAAKAYDFETNFRQGDARGPGSRFLGDIVRTRCIGEINNGIPSTGGYDGGLADPMARMWQNWMVLKGQLGFNNPQTETGRFSLRSELFRIQPGRAGDEVWRRTLERCVVANLLTLPEFQRHCLPFYPQLPEEPAIVIPFNTTVNFGENFFGWPAGGGDNSYDSANFATKVRSAGIWFANYNSLQGSGMINTPRVYLIPAGSDIMRSPSSLTGATREWQVVDQVIPVPYALSEGDLDAAAWIPANDSLFGSFAEIRRFGRILAYHDSGSFNPAEVATNTRLIGRSVWNTRWLLIVPGGALHSDRTEGLTRFIHGALTGVGDTRDGNGVKDIKVFFQTYAYPGY